MRIILTFLLYNFLLLIVIETCVAQGLPPGWDFGATPSTHIISVPLESHPNINGYALQPGDYIGVFYINDDDEYACGGASEWLGNQNTGIIAFGDDAFTSDKDGFSAGETINYKFYSWSLFKEYDAEVICNDGLPTTCDIFASGGLSGIDSIWSDGFYIVAFVEPESVCSGNETQLLVLPSGGFESYTYEWTSDPAGFTSVIANPVDFPTQNTTYFITVTDNGIESLALSVNVETTPEPVSVAGNNQTICEDATVVLSGEQSNGSAFFWSSDGDGTFIDINMLDTEYTPGESDLSSGGVLLSLNVLPVEPCTQTALSSIDVSVISFPEVQAGNDQTICETNSANISAVVLNTDNFLWSSNGDGFFDNPNLSETFYTPGSDDIQTGYVVLSITAVAINPCSATAIDSFSLIIVSAPVIEAGENALICEEDNVVLNGEGFNVFTSSWETSGDGTFDDVSNLSAIYFPGIEDIDNQGVEITLIAQAILPCSGEVIDQLQVIIHKNPVVAAGNDATICELDDLQLSGNANYYDEVLWITIGDGTFSDPNNLNSLYFPGSSDILTGLVEILLSAQPLFPCTVEVQDNLEIQIQSLPFVDAGEDATIQAEDSYLLMGVADNYNIVEWNSDGDGTFDDLHLLNPVYTPGNLDISNAGVSLHIIAQPIVPCSSSINDQMMLSIDTLTAINYFEFRRFADVFPNPSKGKFSVVFSDKMSKNIILIKIFDDQGSCIMLKEISPSELEMDRTFYFNLKSQDPGIYFMHISTDMFYEHQKILILQ